MLRRRPSYKYLYSPAGQEIWAQQGYRPVDLSVYNKHKADFPIRPQLFTIKYLGGWSKVTPQFFDPQNGIMARIEQEPGLAVCRSGLLTAAFRESSSAGYLSLIVLLPLAAVIAKASGSGFWVTATNSEAVAALKLTLGLSVAVCAINAVTGTVIAWVLVRDSFRGQAIVNA